MGSRTSGRLRDYRQGGEPQEGDRCENELTDVKLEEVATSQYYTEHDDVPPAGTPVSLQSELVGGRLAVRNNAGEVIGLLPTRFNYLVACMARDYSYAGQVASSSKGALPRIAVNLAPSR